MTSLNYKVPGRKFAAITAILSLPFAYLTQGLFTLASDGDVTVFHSGAQMMALPSDKIELFYAALWTDILGYYLIFLPLIVFAWKALRHLDEAVTDIAFLCGLIYCLLGSMGAVQMAGAIDALHSPVASDASAAAWEATIGGAWRGYWLLEGILAAIWLGGLAKLLNAAGLRGLGIGAASLALIWVIQFLAWHAGLPAISDGALVLVVLLSPIWSVWLGVTLLRAPTPPAAQN